jgi:hypothetical protein
MRSYLIKKTVIPTQKKKYAHLVPLYDINIARLSEIANDRFKHYSTKQN